MDLQVWQSVESEIYDYRFDEETMEETSGRTISHEVHGILHKPSMHTPLITGPPAIGGGHSQHFRMLSTDLSGFCISPCHWHHRGAESGL